MKRWDRMFFSAAAAVHFRTVSLSSLFLTHSSLHTLLLSNSIYFPVTGVERTIFIILPIASARLWPRAEFRCSVHTFLHQCLHRDVRTRSSILCSVIRERHLRLGAMLALAPTVPTCPAPPPRLVHPLHAFRSPVTSCPLHRHDQQAGPL